MARSHTQHENDDRKYQLKRRMRFMLIFVGILFGSIFIYKVVMGLFMRYAISSQSHTVTVSTMKVDSTIWDAELKAVGSLRAIRGVNVTSELAGLIRYIYFTPGTLVSEGTVLLELNIDSDEAQLQALQATAELNQINLKRDQSQFAIKGVSKAVVDTDAANLKNSLAQVNQQAAIIAKKIIRAPFSGRLGISAVNPGQYLNPGDTIVTLQQLNPIYVDFYLPQQALPNLKVGQSVTLASDAVEGQVFKGKITTINPLIDTSTRNVEIEATIDNPQFTLVPGMFATVNVNIGEPKSYITAPQTAISFNPYGDTVYLVNHDKKKLIVKQIFVTQGETRGEQVAILTGLKKGDEIVTSGQLKLKNGSEIVVDNSVAPPNNSTPKLPNEH